MKTLAKGQIAPFGEVKKVVVVDGNVSEDIEGPQRQSHAQT